MVRLLAAAVVMSGLITGQTAAEPAAVSVREDEGVYYVLALFSVAQPVSIVRDVLTDYEQIPRFMPDVKTSVVVERSPRLLVRQEASSKLGMFSKR